MGNLLGDVRYACRSLARQPTFALVGILTLVLGIGTNTAIFSVIKAVLLNQLPYQDPLRLVVLSEQSPEGRSDLVAPLTYVDTGPWFGMVHVDACLYRNDRVLVVNVSLIPRSRWNNSSSRFWAASTGACPTVRA